jgi:hypothetical protein
MRLYRGYEIKIREYNDVYYFYIINVLTEDTIRIRSQFNSNNGALNDAKDYIDQKINFGK